MPDLDSGSSSVRLARQSTTRRSLAGLLAGLGHTLSGVHADDALAKKRKKNKKKKGKAGSACAAGEITCPSGSISPCCPADQFCCDINRIGCCTAR